MDMKALTQQPAWAKVTALLVVGYVAVFQIPGIWMNLEWLLEGILSANFLVIMTRLLGIVLIIANLAIWLLSTYLCALAYHATKKKSYAFLLAFLLMCTITTPVTYLSKMVAYHRWQNSRMETSEDLRRQMIQHPVNRPHPAQATSALVLPVGPALLLLAIWSMCQADGIRLTNKPKH